MFLPQDSSFLSFGVVKARAAKPTPIGLEGVFYPTFAMFDGDPVTVFPDDRNPLLSMLAYTGDLGLDDGEPQSVYVLDKDAATQLESEDGKPFRLDLSVGETIELPDGLGSVTFERVDPWVRVQISQTPGKEVALAGVVLALIGLCGSLFVRPRRVWVRAQAAAGTGAGDTMDRTVVEVAGLDRSGNGDMAEVLADVVTALRQDEKGST
ncbi:cytochrome c biogenesis protein ResB [Nocardioides sp. TF02-7]|uniref:cytochrome c biogenesis protein ResB n=1 Tax=Nocardioides sp. TF02-7 TaxID=2917724 RepID=UPI001F05A589|nr:cytochrome c biogenesis protein ResB [Nocardioides sp. TF02-7]UMG93844.1 cytochrome c biogenesis protein ResB [Nocardioides sp. TF02-7]